MLPQGCVSQVTEGTRSSSVRVRTRNSEERRQAECSEQELQGEEGGIAGGGGGVDFSLTVDEEGGEGAGHLGETEKGGRDGESSGEGGDRGEDCEA